MHVALFLILLAVGVLVVTTLSERAGIPAPLSLIAVGVAASYCPGVPEVRLEPDIVLLGLLPPLLYSTAIRSSLVDFRSAWRTITLLSVGLVVFTALGVGLVVHLLVPGLPWWAALAIGAVVAPPDAVAATAIGRRIGLPRGVVTILEGESLLNDATALVFLRTAVAAGLIALGPDSSTDSISAGEVVLDFLIAAGGGVLAGLVVYKVIALVRQRVEDAVLDTAISLVVPFAAYVLAEEVEASGVIAVVVAGLLLGHEAPVLMSAQSRIAERINYRTISYVLENAVFLLIGLQAARIFREVGDSELGAGRIVLVCVLALLTVVVLRMLWVFANRALLLRPRLGFHGSKPPWGSTFIIGWAGMRGVVTLAAAFVIPERAPDSEVLLLIAFTVVAGTLFLQGATLPMVARRLHVRGPDPMEDALARATVLQAASKAGYHELKKQEYDDAHGVVELIKQRVDQRNFAAWERLGTTAEQETPSELYGRIRLAMIGAERRKVLKIRDDGRVPSDIVDDVLAALDVEESMIDRAQDVRADDAERSTSQMTLGLSCDDLDRFPAIETEVPDCCQDCLDEGTTWVALRQCLTCGNVACCDSSPGQHATRHFRDTTHPVMESAEPGEQWRWCYVHHLTA